jgi:hypothetical protein
MFSYDKSECIMWIIHDFIRKCGVFYEKCGKHHEIHEIMFKSLTIGRHS